MEKRGKSAPGEERSIALALANTRHRRGRALVDEIAGAEEGSNWLRGRALLDAPAALTAAELARLHQLRDAVRALMGAALDGTQGPAEAVARVNRAARAAPRVFELEWEAGEPPRRGVVPTPPDQLARALGLIASDAIDLLAGERSQELLACSGPNCVRFLLKDHPRRRWCSPECGQRIRAARYYDRHGRGEDGKDESH